MLTAQIVTSPLQAIARTAATIAACCWLRIVSASAETMAITVVMPAIATRRWFESLIPVRQIKNTALRPTCVDPGKSLVRAPDYPLHRWQS